MLLCSHTTLNTITPLVSHPSCPPQSLKNDVAFHWGPQDRPQNNGVGILRQDHVCTTGGDPHKASELGCPNIGITRMAHAADISISSVVLHYRAVGHKGKLGLQAPVEARANGLIRAKYPAPTEAAFITKIQGSRLTTMCSMSHPSCLYFSMSLQTSTRPPPKSNTHTSRGRARTAPIMAKLSHCVGTACTCRETHPRSPATCLLAQQRSKAHKITTNT